MGQNLFGVYSLESIIHGLIPSHILLIPSFVLSSFLSFLLSFLPSLMYKYRPIYFIYLFFVSISNISMCLPFTAAVSVDNGFF